MYTRGDLANKTDGKLFALILYLCRHVTTIQVALMHIALTPVALVSCSLVLNAHKQIQTTKPARPIILPTVVYSKIVAQCHANPYKQSGCTTVLANYYDLISLLVVPVALVSLFVNITIIALITILKGNYHSLGHDELSPSETGHLAAARCARMKRTANTRNNPVQPAAKFELKSVA